MPLRVLIIDDDPTVRQTLGLALEEPEFKTTAAETGEAGIAAFAPGPWDVLLVDKNLPGMSGIEVIRQVRALDEGVGVIMMTALGTVDSAMETLALGVDGYLEKPFADIFAVIDKVKALAVTVTSRRATGGDAIDHFRRAKEHLTGGAAATEDATRVRALILSQSEADVRFLQTRLEAAAVACECLGDPAELNERVRAFAPQLAFVDVEATKQEPLAFVSDVRRTLPQVACVVVSPRPSLAFVTQLIPLSVSAMLVKPLSPEEFDRRVGGLLERLARAQRRADAAGGGR